jgi:hypothetical protein
MRAVMPYGIGSFITSCKEAYMVRKATTISRAVMDRMRYSRPVQILDFKKAFTGETPQAVKPAKRKAKKPPKRVGVKLPAKAPVFIKKEPVTFQLSREKNKDDFERMAFVIRACSKDPRYKHIMVLHVEQTRTGSRLVATDGRRLHVAEITEKLQSGDYIPSVTKETVRLGEPATGIMFPNWSKILPIDTAMRGFINLEDTAWGRNQKQTDRLSRAFNSFVRMTGELINVSFLEDLTKKEWSVHCQAGKNHAILLKEVGAKMSTYAVLMPLPDNAAKAA